MNRHVLILVSSLFLAGVVIAGTCAAGPKVAVHVLPYYHAVRCGNLPDIECCDDIVTTCGECDAMVAFPVFYDLEEYQGLYYGLSWPGPYGGAFVSCSDLEAGAMRRSGDTIAQRWLDCHRESTVIPGYIVLYPMERGHVCVLPYSALAGIGVVDCLDRTDGVRSVACAGVCGMEGEYPCHGCARHLVLDFRSDVGQECVIAGHFLTYTLTYRNTSSGFTAENVMLSIVLSDQTEFSSASPGGRYSSWRGAVEWKVGDVLPGAYDSVHVTVKVDWESPPETEVICRGQVFCDGTSLVAPDTALVCRDTYTPLSLAKDDGVGAAGFAAGDTLSYIIAYGNTVNDIDVHNIMLVDRLPEGVRFLRASDDGLYEEVKHRVRWELGTLAAGGTGAVSLTVNTGAHWDEGAKIKNVVEIVCDETRRSRAEAFTEVTHGWMSMAAVHVEPCGETRTCTGGIPELKTCEDIKTYTEGCGCIRVFPVFIDIPEYTGLNYSLYWPEEWGDMVFVSCSDVTVGDIVKPGDAIQHSWTRCRSKTFAVPGFGEIFASDPGYMWVDEHRDYDMVCAVDCDGDRVWVRDTYVTAVCGADLWYDYCLPCGNVPSERTFYKTWGGIKAMFR